MKTMLLAAAAFIATPLIAQTAPTTPPADQATPPADQPVPPADAAAPAPAEPAAPPAPMAQTTDATPTAAAADTAGGYQPAGPALQGTPAPGATVRFQQAPTPEQAYPAPAPLAKYPICKKGQYDNCMQRGGK